MVNSIPARLGARPQYVLHPSRLARRVLQRFPANSDPGTSEVVRLPWGLPLEVQRSDAIGYSIIVGRVFDPCVTEALWRLIEPGETVVDVGANIGYTSSLAAVRAGPGGRVLSFEPHPVVFEQLERNVNRWPAHGVAAVEAQRRALSDRAGQGELAVVGAAFHLNMGLATLRTDEAARPGEDVVGVELVSADDALGELQVGLMKIDVEGHETEVLAGAGGMLASRRIRDLIFEDHEPYPSTATRLLEDAGYRLFALEGDLLGIVLAPPESRVDAPAWPWPSYLATCEPERATARMQPRWWRTPGILPRPWGRILQAIR